MDCTFNVQCLRKYSAPLNFATFCHISGFKHKDVKLYFFVKNQQQVGTIMKWNDIYWIFQTFLTNQKLKNWPCKIIHYPIHTPLSLYPGVARTTPLTLPMPEWEDQGEVLPKLHLITSVGQADPSTSDKCRESQLLHLNLISPYYYFLSPSGSLTPCVSVT